MNFVLIFRQNPTVQLSDADLQKRGDEIRAWAKQHNALGRNLAPRSLASQRHTIAPNGSEASDEADPITALLFLEAEDFAEAVNVARSHPASRYGVSVEVRPWSVPQPVQPQR